MRFPSKKQPICSDRDEPLRLRRVLGALGVPEEGKIRLVDSLLDVVPHRSVVVDLEMLPGAAN